MTKTVEKTAKTLTEKEKVDTINNDIPEMEKVDTVNNDIPEKSGLKRLERKRKRQPLGEQRALSAVQDPEGYVGRWVNDDKDNVFRLEKAGWQIVDRNGSEIDADSRIQTPGWEQRALSQNVGGGIVAYYMRIPKEWYEEDQARKQAAIDAREAHLRTPQSVGIDPSKTYGEIKIEHK